MATSDYTIMPIVKVDANSQMGWVAANPIIARMQYKKAVFDWKLSWEVDIIRKLISKAMGLHKLPVPGCNSISTIFSDISSPLPASIWGRNGYLAPKLFRGFSIPGYARHD